MKIFDIKWTSVEMEDGTVVPVSILREVTGDYNFYVGDDLSRWTKEIRAMMSLYDKDAEELAAAKRTLPPGLVWTQPLLPNFEESLYQKPTKACECGSEKVGSPRHSTWCPKFVSDEPA